MPRTKGASELKASKVGAILALKENTTMSNVQVARRVGCDEKTVRNTLIRTHDLAEKENIPPLQATENLHTHVSHRSGRPPVISERQARRLIRQATKNRAQRRKKWTVIAAECGIRASESAIRYAFESQGYGRYPPRYKPHLTAQQKLARLNFAVRYLEEGEAFWNKVVWTDETPVKVGEIRGQVWVTRKNDEAYHKDCLNVAFKKYTDLQYWACYTKELKGPYHFFARETTDEKKEAGEALQAINSDWHAEAQLLANQFHAEQAKKAPSKRLKRVPKPNKELFERSKTLKGGIDWYRYRTEILHARLLPFCRQVIKKYGECFLLEDGAASHIAWQNNEEYNIEGLNRLPWPANSPDFNMIESTWYHLKRKVPTVGFPATDIESTKQAWIKLWDELSQDCIRKWVERMPYILRRCKDSGGDNNYHD